MKIKSVKVGATVYRVEPWDSFEADDAGKLADCSTTLARIRVVHGPSLAVTAETLIHEILHAMVNDAGLGWDEDVEEPIVRALSPRLAAFMADNEDAVHDLLDMLAGR